MGDKMRLTSADLLYVTLNASEADKELWKASVGREYDPLDAARIFYEANDKGMVLKSPEGVPYMVGGVIYRDDGVAETWAVNTDELKANLKSAIKTWKKFLKSVLDGGASRIECETLASISSARRLYEICGGKFVSILPGLGTMGEDYVLYAWENE